MDLSKLKPAEGATSNSKRIGRGQGSGKGGTSTRGHKGAQSRSGYSRKIGFEVGQMPIYRILPKRGFKNISDITPEVLAAHGLAKKKSLIKILAKGELTAKVNVTAHAISQKAKEAIENAGGTITLIGQAAEEKAE